MSNWSRIMGQSDTSGSTLSVTFGLLDTDNETAGDRELLVWASQPRCYHDGFHTVRRVHAKGSNQYRRRETGECIYCRKVHTRTIRWDTKDARDWWRATP